MRVVQYAAPTPDEKRHQYLLRFAAAMPGWGGMAVLDRSWYGRVLVERVEGFATPEEWQRAYGEINDYERALTADGMILVKLFLHVSDEEQLKRFEAREEDPLKAWKLTDEDWRNRGKRARVRGRDRGDARAHVDRLRAVDARRGRLEALCAGEGDRDRLRRDRSALALTLDLARLLLGAGLLALLDLVQLAGAGAAPRCGGARARAASAAVDLVGRAARVAHDQ